MKKISFNILYWNGFDSETRLKNALFCYEKIKKFSEYAKCKKIDVEVCLFDFSETKELENSIHIPYKNGEFKKSEKINKVIEYNYNHINPDIFAFLDSDVFFEQSEFDKLINEINNFKSNTMTICGVLDIQNTKDVDYYNNEIINRNILVKPRLMSGLGAFYMIDFNILFNIGGFDERFICWGGEDDDVGYRLIKKGINRMYTSIQLLHLPHETLSNEAINSNQYKRQCSLIGNNDIITKYSLITDKYLK